MKVHSFNKEALFSITNLDVSVHSPEDFSKLLNTLVEKMAKIMKADACSLYLLDNAKNALVLKASFGLSKEFIENITFKSGEGATGETLRILQPISITNINKSRIFIPIKGYDGKMFKSFLSVPLIYFNKPIGVISIQNKKTRNYLKKDVDLLITLSVAAVHAIEKAKFIDAVREVTPVSPLTKTPEDKTQDVTLEYLKDHFIKGIPAVPGIAMGYLKIVHKHFARRHDVETEKGIKQEIERLKEAFQQIRKETQDTKQKAEKKFGPDEASIFDAYLLFLESDTFQHQIIKEIQDGLSAISALDKVVLKYTERMADTQDEYIKERSYDIQDVARKIRDHLLYGASSDENPFLTTENTIFCNEFWSVSDFVHLDLKKTQGIISPNGSATSHIAILADTLNLPSVLGIGSSSTRLRDHDYIIIDGYSGSLIVNPTKKTIEIYKKEILELQKKEQSFQIKKEQKVKLGITTKHFFPIGANLGMVAHVPQAIEFGADAVGLYRTEFPFLVRQSLPTEEEQFMVYKRVLEMMQDRPVVFRTLDIGGDKYIAYLNLPKENNPALGWRAIRFSLERKDLFRIQLRALLRASAFGKMFILFPMITQVDELRECKQILESVKRELSEENVKFDRHIPLGAMLEVPSAVETTDILAKEVEFFSLGTNDLTQYCLAVDRSNPLVAALYDPYHPALIKMVNKAIQEAHRAGRKISLCGDVAANPLLAAVLIGLGIDSLSMIPRTIPKIKSLARCLDEPSVVELALKCLKLETGKEIKKEIEEYFKSHDLVDFIPETQTAMDKI